MTKGFREQLYLDLASHLNKMVGTDSKPVIKTIDLWNEQWANMDKETAFPFPAVFIEFKGLGWKPSGNKTQTSEALICFHIGSITMHPTKFAGDIVLPKGLEHLRLIDALHYWMGRLTGDNFGTLTRIASEHDHNHGDLFAHVETYRLFAKDAGTQPAYVALEGDKLKLSLL